MVDMSNLEAYTWGTLVILFIVAYGGGFNVDLGGGVLQVNFIIKEVHSTFIMQSHR